MFHSLKLLSQLRHPEPRRGEGSHFDEILRSGFPWKIPFQRKPESSLLGRPFGPQNDKINFMSPTAPVDGIMLSKLDITGQTMIEFSFCLIVIIILLLGMIKVFVWSGKDLADRRKMHEKVLTNPYFSPEEQIRPGFYYSSRVHAEVDSNIFK